MKKYLAEFDRILNDSFNYYYKKVKRPAVCLSGGIDSSIISFFVRKYFKKFIIVSLVSEKSKDRSYVIKMSNFLRQKITWIYFNQNSVKKNITEVKEILKKNGIPINITQISLALGLFLIGQKLRDLKISWVFSGQGPDVLLGGYHRYRGININNINQKIKKDLSLIEVDKKREEAIAKHFGLKIIYPYLTKEFIDFALKIPGQYKINKGVEKFILRCYGQYLGLPQEIVNRSKKAFQYSTGIQKLIDKQFVKL